MILTFEQSRAYYAYRLNMDKPPNRDAFMHRCPFHGDRTASLSVSLAKGVWNCQAGCGNGGIFDFEKMMFPTHTNDEHWENIQKIAGIVSEKRQNPSRGKVIATYDYTDAAGKLLFQKLRYENKDFVQRAVKGAGWSYTLSDVRKVLYHLPEVVRASVAFICEGEKDCDNVRAIDFSKIEGFNRPEFVYAFTTNFDGAGKWKEEYSPYFSGKRVIILEDNDDNGRAHAQAVAASVFPFAEGVKIVNFEEVPPKGDVSDFLANFSVEALIEKIKKAPKWAPAVVDKDSSPFFVSPSKMRPAGGSEVEWLIPGIIHKGGKGMIVAAPKAGKSMVALDIAVALASAQSWCGFQPYSSIVRCGIISREDGPELAYRRVLAFAAGRGIPMGLLEDNIKFNTYNQRRTFSLQSVEDVADVVKWIKEDKIEFCVFDVLNILHNADENSNTEMTKIMKSFDTIRMESGAQVTVIHHTSSAVGQKRPRGAGAIDSWWDWKISIAPTPEDEAVKDVQFFTKAGKPIPPMQILFDGDGGETMTIQPVRTQSVNFRR